MQRQRKLRRSTGRNRKLLVLTSAWVYLALLSPAIGAEAILNGRTIKFEPPNGYCLLNELTNGERQAVEAMRQLQQPDNELIWMFVPCGQLAALRAGKEGRLEQFGYVTAVQPNGVFRPMRGVSRFEFASKVARTIPPMDAAGVARELSRRPITQNAPRFNLLHSGLAVVDAAAVYLGLVVEENWGRTRTITAGVTAITLVRDLPISLTLHGPFSGISYPILRTELRPLISDFITRNEPGVQPFQRIAATEPQRSGASWWTRLVLFGSATLLVSILLGSVLLAAMRRLRQPPHLMRRQPLATHLARRAA
jgi:hypothetical protein